MSLGDAEHAAANDRDATPEGAMLTRRSLVLCVVLGCLSLLWVRQVELIKMSCQVSESVPPVPALAALMLGVLMLGSGRRAIVYLTTSRRRLGRPGLVLLALGLTLGSMASPLAHVAGGLCLLTGLFAVALSTSARFAQALDAHASLTRPEALAVYCVLTVVPVFASVGVIRVLLPCVTALPYFASGTNHFAELGAYIPRWFGPQDPEAIRQFYEGVDVMGVQSAGEGLPIISDLLSSVVGLARTHTYVPWGEWFVPLWAWGLFLMVFFATMLCCVRLFRHQWTERERLGYPIVQFALDMTQPGGASYAGVSFFTDRLMWIGLGISFVFNGANLLHAIHPAFPAPGQYYGIGALFTEHPWNSLGGLAIAFRPELVGLGYLVSLEVLLSVWVFYLLIQVETVAMTAMGLMYPGYPFMQEQSAGAYVAMGLFLAWGARGPLIRVLSHLRTRVGLRELPEFRYALGAAAGGLFLIAFCVAAGMALWVALVYMALLLLFALVYARVRAEAGAPMVWVFPFYQQQKMIHQVFGFKMLAPGGDFRSATILSSMMWLSRGYFPSLMGTQLDGYRIADLYLGGSRQMTRLLLLAAVIGIIGGGWMHLTTYYDYGGNVLEGGSTQGGYRTQLAIGEYTNLDLAYQAPTGPDRARVEAHLAGGGLTLGLIALRRAFLKFPLHPLGFAMATAYGQPMWAAFLFVWIVKSTILRVGGIGLYRRLIPLFLGIALGHFLAAGVLLGLGGLWGGELFTRYAVHFG